jgi:hypothetical protein
MVRARLLPLPGVLLVLALQGTGCGGRDPLTDPAFRGDGGTVDVEARPDVVPAPDVAPPDLPQPDVEVDGGPPDVGFEPPPDVTVPADLLQLQGHWVQDQIGDCINAFDWLSFGPPPQLVHTVDDQNFCSEHHYLVDEGSYSELPERVLELDLPFPDPTGTGDGGRWVRQRTSALVMRADAAPPGGGPRLLVTKAYSRREPQTWTRGEVDSYYDATGALTYRSAGSAVLIFDPPPLDSGAHQLTLRLAGEAETPDEGLQSSSDELSLTVQVDFDMATGYLTLKVDVGSDWFTYLNDIGFYQRHPPRAAQAMTDVFRPELLLDPSHPEQPLFALDSSFTWEERLEGPTPPP